MQVEILAVGCPSNVARQVPLYPKVYKTTVCQAIESLGNDTEVPRYRRVLLEELLGISLKPEKGSVLAMYVTIIRIYRP